MLYLINFAKKMKLEHRKQSVAPLSRFIRRVTAYASLAFVLITISLGIGMLGYHYYGKLNWLDSFHTSEMILTGMGPVAEMTSDNGKVFSSCYALFSGVTFWCILAVFFTPIVHRLLHILHEDNR